MNENKLALVPFGKYRGQPIERLYQDESYTKWIKETDGIKQRYPDFYNLVINNFTTIPVDTPEHNEMQIKFLNPEYRIKLAYKQNENFFRYDNKHFLKMANEYYQAVKLKVKEYQFGGSNLEYFHKVLCWKFNQDLLDDGIDYVEFESKGIDVIFGISYGYSLIYGNHKFGPKEGFQEEFEFKIELKPELGDDFPSIFRQMKNDHSTLLIIKDFTATNVSYNQVLDYFYTGMITILKDEEIEKVELPLYDKKIYFEPEMFDMSKEYFKNHISKHFGE